MVQVQEITVSYRPEGLAEMPKVTSSQDACDILMSAWNQDEIAYRESFKVVLLNRANKALAVYNGFEGGMDGTVADIRMIFAVALKAAAHAIIISHNHPSGNANPSEADKVMTAKMVGAGELLNIPVLDHIIVTADGSYYSFADEGRL